eukprot:TRINITY_DN21302_c0_g1_i1.p1 TRINITY_DN21302_c0_g1~~TRINITY_DN21302_c0_g1_i1.p1  ORF type:complete len:285 (-),score=91.80 TRINITY_DN21302_c0_g1_i1:37-822(-)
MHSKRKSRKADTFCTFLILDSSNPSKSAFLGPLYNGVFIESLVQGAKKILEEDSLLAKIYADLLSISTYSFLYYYSCCTTKWGASKSCKTLANFSAPHENIRKRSSSTSRDKKGGDTPTKSIPVRASNSSFVNPSSPDVSSSPPFSSLQYIPKIAPQSPSVGRSSDSPRTSLTMSHGSSGSVSSVGFSSLSLDPIMTPTEKFFQRFNIKGSDQDIVQYLAEAVKEQQCKEVLGEGWNQPTKLDLSICSQLVNTPIELKSNK